MQRTRKFGNRTYVRSESFNRKSEAQGRVKKEREQGNIARITKQRNPLYSSKYEYQVWVAPRRR